MSKNLQPKLLGLVWGDFMSLCSRFYEVTIFESTYATSEGKKYKCISRC
jgi:hypothetical protein